jgi:CheY-like chemotaxis protein
VSPGRALVAVAAELQQQVIEALDGWTLHVCADGEEAIDHLWEGSPDAIVLDFDLPRMTAYDVIRHLAMRRPELLCRTTLLMGSDENARALIQGVAVGRCLAKPVGVQALCDALRGT